MFAHNQPCMLLNNVFSNLFPQTMRPTVVKTCVAPPTDHYPQLSNDEPNMHSCGEALQSLRKQANNVDDHRKHTNGQTSLHSCGEALQTTAKWGTPMKHGRMTRQTCILVERRSTVYDKMGDAHRSTPACVKMIT